MSQASVTNFTGLRGIGTSGVGLCHRGPTA